MRITKRQLRRLIRESCGLDAGPAAPAPVDVPLQMELPADEPTVDVPVPQDYEAVRGLLEQNPDLVSLAIQMVMDAAGTGCERSSAQAIIDHLQDMLGNRAAAAAPSPMSGLGFIKGPGF